MKKSSHPRTVFLTGATGLVGSYLLKILLEHGHKVYVLSRQKNNQSAKQRIVDSLAFWDKTTYSKNQNNLAVLTGELTQIDFGLPENKLEELKGDVEEIFHSAAITDINLPLDKIKRVNVEGTKHVLNFAAHCRKLLKTNHISTAYVCGNHKGIFKEEDLDVYQKFNSTYEQSKFEAEKLVQVYRKNMIIDIFRPSLVIGESRTGKITQFRNIYQFLHMCCLELFESFPDIDGHLSLVPVDEAAKAIYLISSDCKIKNGTYHILPNKLLPMKELVQHESSYLGFKKPKFVPYDEFISLPLTHIQKEILKRNILSLNLSVKLNSLFTEKILECYGFRFSKQNPKTLARIFNFFKSKNAVCSKEYRKKWLS